MSRALAPAGTNVRAHHRDRRSAERKQERNERVIEARSVAQTIERLRSAAQGAPNKTRRRAVLDEYISEGQRDDPSAGCIIAALGTETARLNPAVRGHFDRNVESMLQLLMDGGKAPASRAHAMRTLTMAIGAVVLARTVRSKELSNEILDAARRMP